MTDEAMELLPCPFCDGDAALTQENPLLPNGQKDTLYYVHCTIRECGARTLSWYPHDAARRTWNRRALLAQPKAASPTNLSKLVKEATSASAAEIESLRQDLSEKNWPPKIIRRICASLATSTAPILTSAAPDSGMPEEAVVFTGICSDGTLRISGEFVTRNAYQHLRAYALSLLEQEGMVPRSVLESPVQVIKDWHNMDGSDDVWQIYYDNAPEMKPIRDALAAAPSAGGEGT